MLEKANIIYNALRAEYPHAKCELNYTSTFELLVAVILSAQCTDKRVNLVTKQLFLLANTPTDMLQLGSESLQKLIHSCGFYRQKAKSIINASRDIILKHGGQVPNSRAELEALSGVGRKTASVMLSEAFNQNAIAVDTHVFRVSKRLGLSSGKTPLAVEKDLNGLYPTNGSQIHQLLIFHGRYCCRAIKPECSACVVSALCECNK